MSLKPNIGTRGSVKTRSQASHRAEAQKDDPLNPADKEVPVVTIDNPEGSVKSKKIHVSTPKEKKKKSNKTEDDKASSSLNLELFDEHNPSDSEDASSPGSDGSSSNGVPSVASHLHVSLDDVEKKKRENLKKPPRKPATKSSRHSTSVASMTASEWAKLQIEIKKLELKGEKEQLKIKVALEQKKLDAETKKREDDAKKLK